MDFTYYIAHGLGFLAMGINFWAVFSKDDNKLMSLAILGCLIFIPHFLLLGSPVSAVSVGLIALRIWFAKNYKSAKVMYVFIGIAIIQAFIMVENINEIFSILATLFATIIYFKLTGIQMRLAFVVTCLLWVIDSIVIGSWSNGILNLVGAVIHIITAYRIYIDTPKEIIKEY